MKTGAWFEEQRINWIAEMLDIYGFINRAHLQRKFRISTPQASLDLRNFQQVHPGKMAYSKGNKCYYATTSPEKK